MLNEHPAHDSFQEEQPIAHQSLFSTHWEEKEAEDKIIYYSQFNVLGPIAFALSLLSLLSFLFFYLLISSALGILTALGSVFSLRRAGGEPREYFFAGSAVFLSVFSLVGVITMLLTYNHQIEQEGPRFFQMWFQAIREQNLPLVYEMRGYTWDRSPYQNLRPWWEKHLRMSEEDTTNFVNSLNNPILRTLWELGDKAEYTLYGMPRVFSLENKDYAFADYAVTYPTEDGSKETFFIRVQGERIVNPKDRRQRGWCLHGAPELIPIPPELRKQEKGR